MKVVILYKPGSEHDSSVNAYVDNYKRQTNNDIELIDAESRRGVDVAKIHDILAFPSMLALSDEGLVLEAWPNRESWPTASELSYYH